MYESAEGHAIVPTGREVGDVDARIMSCPVLYVSGEREERCHDSKTVNTTCIKNKAGYTATPVACRWAGAVSQNT